MANTLILAEPYLCQKVAQDQFLAQGYWREMVILDGCLQGHIFTISPYF